jgi:hypothetical protein
MYIHCICMVYIHCICMVYTMNILWICRCQTYPFDIPSLYLMGLFHTFFYNDMPMIYQVHSLNVFCFQFSKKSEFFSFSGFRGTHHPPAQPICICVIRWGSTSMDDAYDILCLCCVYTIHILTKILGYTNYNILICHVYIVYILYIYWLKYFDIPTKIFWYAMYMLCFYNTYTDNLFLSGTWPWQNIT